MVNWYRNSGMELFPAVPGIVRGVPDGKTGTPRVLEVESIMEGTESVALVGGMVALAAGDTIPC